MGNLISSEKVASSNVAAKIPKHLQPTKQKPTFKKSDSIPAHAKKKRKDARVPLKSEVILPGLKFKWFEEPKSFCTHIEGFLPNNKTEQDRHRIQFYIIRWAFGRHHIIPQEIALELSRGIQVLEINCGPGLWASHPILDMAQDFTQSTFNLVDIQNTLYPTDSFNTQSTTSSHRALNNFRFFDQNIQQNRKLPFDTHQIDYFQQTMATLSYTNDDWMLMMKEMLRVTKPGGYVQLIELELIPHNVGPRGKLWLEQVCQNLKKHRNIKANAAIEMEQMLKSIGLVDIQSEFVSIPLGSWGLDIGCLWKENYDSFFKSAKPYLSDITGVSSKEFKSNMRIFEEELDEYKPFNNIHLVWGRIPCL
ncbi:hypothetical protein BY458DRAFT_527978 [Sporodiniella umbellata]|nr:hypothetical protein BY458DRAFT_527978 [Sporodiniella umbellata]